MLQTGQNNRIHPTTPAPPLHPEYLQLAEALGIEFVGIVHAYLELS
jgi:hypothetical protein